MTTFADNVARLLAEAENGATEDERGKKFEALLQFLFESVPGTVVVPNTRNYFGGEQVDLAVGNGGGFLALPDKFLVECKNYSHKLDSKAVGYFLFICVSRGAELAIIAATEGLTGAAEDTTYAHSLALAASAMGCRLVVLTKGDLVALTSPDDLVDVLRKRFLQAFSSGGIGA